MPVLIVVAILSLLIVFLYNGLIRLRVQCDNAWADIDVQLKRRYDLIPNLVETVKGYASHERGTFEAVTAACVRGKAEVCMAAPNKRRAAAVASSQRGKAVFIVK